MIRTGRKVSKTSFAIFTILIRVGVTVKENISSSFVPWELFGREHFIFSPPPSSLRREPSLLSPLEKHREAAISQTGERRGVCLPVLCLYWVVWSWQPPRWPALLPRVGWCSFRLGTFPALPGGPPRYGTCLDRKLSLSLLFRCNLWR